MELKVRADFVTNSSSSSFVMLAKPIETLEELSEAANPVAILNSWDGPMVIDITKKFMPLIKKHFSDIVVVDSYFSESECGSGAEIPVKTLRNLPEGVCVYGGECSINSPNDADELREMLEWNS